MHENTSDQISRRLFNGTHDILVWRGSTSHPLAFSRRIPHLERHKLLSLSILRILSLCLEDALLFANECNKILICYICSKHL